MERFVLFSLKCSRNEKGHYPVPPCLRETVHEEGSSLRTAFSVPLTPRHTLSWLSSESLPTVRIVKALSELFCSFPDQEVRRMAVQWIGSLSDAELLDYLPQLVQV